MSKLVEEIVKENVNYGIQNKTLSILGKILDKSAPGISTDQLVLRPTEFSLSLNNTDLPKKINSNKDYILTSYQFSKVNNIKEDKFIIYPEEYSNSEILNSKYELIVNNNLFNKLLENDINPYILDSNNQSAIFTVLKLHNCNIIKELKKRIDFREY